MRVNLDRNEAEVVAQILTVVISETDPWRALITPGEMGIARSLCHRIYRALEPERAVLTEGED